MLRESLKVSAFVLICGTVDVLLIVAMTTS